MDDMEIIIAQEWAKPLPAGKVRVWEDDGQGGGYIRLMTPEAADVFLETRRRVSREDYNLCQIALAEEREKYGYWRGYPECWPDD